MPRTSAPMASPVTTLRVPNFCVLFFHWSSSIWRMKCICSGERGSFVGSILVATRAPGSFGVLSAMIGAVGSRIWREVASPEVAAGRCISNDTLRRGDVGLLAGEVPSASCEICETEHLVQRPNRAPLAAWRFLPADVGLFTRSKRGGLTPSPGGNYYIIFIYLFTFYIDKQNVFFAVTIAVKLNDRKLVRINGKGFAFVPHN